MFFLRKTSTIHISNFCSGMPLRKLHELTFLWFGVPGPFLILIDVCSVALLVAGVRIPHVLKGFPSERRIYEGTLASRQNCSHNVSEKVKLSSAFMKNVCNTCDLSSLLCFHVCHSRVHNNKDPEISMTVSLLQEYLADCCDTSARKSHFHVRPREGSLNLRFLSVASTYGKPKPLSAEATIRMSIQRAIMQVLFLAVAVQVVIFGVSCCVFTSATPESITTKPPKSL